MKNITKWIVAICSCLVLTLCISTNTYAENHSIATNDSWVEGSAEKYQENYYAFTIPSAGKIVVTYQSYRNGGHCDLYDGDLVKDYGGVGYHTAGISGSDTSPGTSKLTRYLEAGTYQLKLYGWDNIVAADTKYKVKILFTPANNNETEPNNTFDAAMPLASGKQVKALFSDGDLLDIYKFTINSQMTVKITINTSLENAVPDYELSVWNSDLIEEKKDSNTSSGQTYIWEKTMGPGTYYIKMAAKGSFGYYDTSVGHYMGLYTLKWEGLNRVTSIKLKKTSMTLAKGETYSLLESVLPSTATNKNLNWESDNKSVVTVNSSGKVTAKNVGAATITATAQDGSKASASCKIVVKPAKAVIKSCKRAADRNVIVKVQKQKNVSGIQYQLSRKKNFKGKTSSYYAGSTATTATTATLSKNKTYYFRVRMYIVHNGKRYYGDWSATKKVKTKSKTYKRGYYAWKGV